MAAHARQRGIPGSIYKNGNRWWWNVKLPGEDRRKARPLKPDGARFATTDKAVAAVIARQWYQRAMFAAKQAAQGEPLTVGLLASLYGQHLQRKYPPPSDQAIAGKRALVPLVDAFPTTLAEDVTPADIKQVRHTLIADRLALSTINHRLRVIVAAFRWAVEEGLMYHGTAYALECIKPLRRGQFGVKDNHKVEPVQWQTIERTLPHLPEVVADMVRVHWLTGMRSGELCAMRPCDLQRGPEIAGQANADVWLYHPQHHKSERFGHERLIGLGPQAQALLAPYLLRRDPEEAVFSPAESEQLRRQAATEARTTPENQGNRVGSNRRRSPKLKPGGRYTSGVYARRVAEAIRKANAEAEARALAEARDVEPAELIPHWHPHQLRHAYGQRTRAALGIDAVRAQLGHATFQMADHYARLEVERLVREAAKKMG